MSNSNDRRERRQRTDIYPCAFFFLSSFSHLLSSFFLHTHVGTIQSGSSKVWIFDDRCGRGSFECRRRAYRRFLSKIESPAVRRHHFQTYIPTNAYVRTSTNEWEASLATGVTGDDARRHRERRHEKPSVFGVTTRRDVDNRRRAAVASTSHNRFKMAAAAAQPNARVRPNRSTMVPSRG